MSELAVTSWDTDVRHTRKVELQLQNSGWEFTIFEKNLGKGFQNQLPDMSYQHLSRKTEKPLALHCKVVGI